jgi:DNA-binding transcriptional LysR family regulator
VELRHYRHVLALADHASFRKVSEALGISQPALTKSLFQIERDVGHRLFDRHGQTISPTVFGGIVVDAARKMLDSQEAMARAIGQIAALDAGERRSSAGWRGCCTRRTRSGPRSRRGGGAPC